MEILRIALLALFVSFAGIATATFAGDKNKAYTSHKAELKKVNPSKQDLKKLETYINKNRLKFIDLTIQPRGNYDDMSCVEFCDEICLEFFPGGLCYCDGQSFDCSSDDQPPVSYPADQPLDRVQK